MTQEKMRRIITVVWVVTIICSMVACGLKPDNEKKTKTENQVQEEKVDEIVDETEENAKLEVEDELVTEVVQENVAEQKPTEQKPTEQKPTEQKPTEQKPTGQKPAEQKPVVQKPVEQKPVVQQPTEQKPTEQQPVVDNNYFRNDANNTYDVNCVSVKPRYVYWKDGTLYAECFVINGYNRYVSNINVEKIAISNKSGVIATANFGLLDGVVLAPYTHITWTFSFGADCVISPNANLSWLSVDASATYRY